MVDLSANLKDNDTCDASDRQLIARQMLTDGTEQTTEIHEVEAALPEANREESLPKSTKENTKAAHATFCLEWPGLKWRFCRYVDKEFSERIQR
jgi:hypothetical protein